MSRGYRHLLSKMTDKIRVLITGVTGFVGAHLTRALEESRSPGFNIFGTTYPEHPPRAGERQYFVDLRSESDITRLTGEVKPDWVFHLAAVSNVRKSWQTRKETLETNILGTQNLLEAVRNEAPRARVLFISSADVYGAVEEPTGILQEGAPLRIESPYGFSKAAAEMLCGFYEKVEDIDIVIARPFPHTGPGQTADFVCSDWARQIVRIERGESTPALKVGNIDVRRDFSDVRDVVKAYILLLSKGRRGEVYNVCSGRAIALREILDFLIRETTKDMHLSVEADPSRMRKIDRSFQVGSNRKISEETGWFPKIPIDRTLRDLLAYWRQMSGGGS